MRVQPYACVSRASSPKESRLRFFFSFRLGRLAAASTATTFSRGTMSSKGSSRISVRCILGG
eukprot:scaffold88685_cov64-Phaeocystis_antarctica.AAC.1